MGDPMLSWREAVEDGALHECTVLTAWSAAAFASDDPLELVAWVYARLSDGQEVVDATSGLRAVDRVVWRCGSMWPRERPAPLRSRLEAACRFVALVRGVALSDATTEHSSKIAGRQDRPAGG